MPAAGRETPRPGGSSRQRAQILDHAQRLVLQYGALQASAREIAAAAGVSVATFRATFESREELLRAVFERLSQEAQIALYGACDAEGRWVDRVHAAVDAGLTYLDAHPDRARFLICDSLTGDPELQNARRRMLMQIAHALDRGAPEAAEGVSPSPFGAQAVVDGVVAVLQARLIDQASLPLRDISSPLAAVLMLPYLTPEQIRKELPPAAG